MKIITPLLCFSAVWTATAAQIDLSKLPAPSTKTDISYAKDIKPIFDSSCVRCHNDEKHKGGLRLDSLEAALKGGEDGKVILPGNSKESPIVIAVARLDAKKAMPPMPRGPGRGGPGGPGGRPPGASGESSGGANSQQAKNASPPSGGRPVEAALAVPWAKPSRRSKSA